MGADVLSDAAQVKALLNAAAYSWLLAPVLDYF
jgi:hypothetical protein